MKSDRINEVVVWRGSTVFGKILFSPIFYNTMLFFIYLATFGENLKEIRRVKVDLMKRMPRLSCM
jgi:hypothetical protein